MKTFLILLSVFFLNIGFSAKAEACTKLRCPVYLKANLSTQRATLYINGKKAGTTKISSGNRKKGHYTKRWNGRPNGRVYNKYSSRKYPGGDWNGLGNMPYAVFYYGGFAVHGTPSISKLGQEASHGCIRMHPTFAKKFNRAVRKYGVKRTWMWINY